MTTSSANGLRPLPPVGATVIVHSYRKGTHIECIVTESPTPDSAWVPTAFPTDRDRTRRHRISVRGVLDPSYVVRNIAHAVDRSSTATIVYTTMDKD